MSVQFDIYPYPLTGLTVTWNGEPVRPSTGTNKYTVTGPDGTYVISATGYVTETVVQEGASATDVTLVEAAFTKISDGTVTYRVKDANAADINASNVSATGKERIVGFSAIDYDNPTTVGSSPYTATKDGYFVLQSDGSTDMTITIGGNVIQHVYYSQIQDLRFGAPVGKGDVITYVATGVGTQAAYFYSVKGE